MIFQLAGIGAYLISETEMKERKVVDPKVVLIDGIHTVKEGVRTQLNQFLQDGWVYIQGKRYYWPDNLKLLFPVPVEKMDQLS